MAGTLVLGVDATSVETRAVLVDGGTVVRSFVEGPLNVLLDANAFERLVHLIKESGCTVAGLGIGGLRGAREVHQLELQLHARTSAGVVVGENTESALLGAFEGGPGVIVIAHTGSSAMGRDASGRAARAGGYGHVVGDEGSHYWIAQKAIRAAIRSYDGTGPKSQALEQAVLQVYELQPDALMRRITADAPNLSLVASAARALMALTDPLMQQILAEAADDLILMAASVRTKLADDDLPVAMYGAVFQDLLVRRRFVAATNAVDAKMPPEFGAVLLAREAGAQTERDMGWRFE
jgi:glucosamine kinase